MLTSERASGFLAIEWTWVLSYKRDPGQDLSPQLASSLKVMFLLDLCFMVDMYTRVGYTWPDVPDRRMGLPLDPVSLWGLAYCGFICCPLWLQMWVFGFDFFFFLHKIGKYFHLLHKINPPSLGPHVKDNPHPLAHLKYFCSPSLFPVVVSGQSEDAVGPDFA